MSMIAPKPGARDSLAFLRTNCAFLLIVSTFLLFSTKTLFNIPFFVMTVLGAYQLLKSPRALFNNRAIIALLICFLSLWLPQLLSLSDAVDLPRASETVTSYLHFFFAGVFIVLAIQQSDVLQKTNIAVFAILAFWAIDALLQFFVGINLLGYPYEQKGQLTGMFYPKIRLGHVIAVLLPFCFEFLRLYGHRYKWSWLLLVALFAVLLLSGKRVAWIMAGVGSVVYFAYFCIYCRTIRIKVLLVPLVFVIFSMLALVWQYEPTKRRIDNTLMLFSGNYELMEKATARRLPLWETTIRIFKDNWLNGVGPRGFRFVYTDYAREGDYWIKDGRAGTTHPHQTLLEIAAETGVIGLIGFLFFCCYLFFIAIKQLPHHHEFVPWLLCAAIAWLPINAHMAFYGSYWSSIGWWILCIALAQLFRDTQQQAA